MKILFCASEAVPFAKTGGLADVVGALPLALEELGQEVIVAMPKYKSIQNSKFRIRRFKEDISYTVIGKDIKVFFIENDLYFNRDGLYGDKTGDYKDNLERFSYFSERILELLRETKIKPNIIHCHDWQTALIPIYLKSAYKNLPFYKKMKSVFTIHNIGYQGLFEKEKFPLLGLDWSLFNMEALEFYDKINILKGGIVFSDIINTVSPTYSREMLTKEQGFGLEGILLKKKDNLFGILNGLDYQLWDPSIDKFIAKRYSIDSAEDKIQNKIALQKECNLPVKTDVPLLGFVGRLAQQKGLDIMELAIEKMCRLDLQLVILGTGDLRYHTLLEKILRLYPNIISLHLKFDDPLAHRIYSGCDMFLMPSHYEPCGLGQMISFKYGTIPIVYKTGGLADTVIDFDPTKDEGNGFVFESYTREGLLEALLRAILTYKDKKKWQNLILGAMKLDFSWKESAKKYLQLYENTVST